MVVAFASYQYIYLHIDTYLQIWMNNNNVISKNNTCHLTVLIYRLLEVLKSLAEPKYKIITGNEF